MRNFILALCISTILVLSSCSSADHNSTGTEYMPDMFHSIAYEANLNDYYYYNTWDSEEDYYKAAQPREPRKGTIPRGYASPSDSKYSDGSASNNAMAIPMNGHVPYYYKDTEEERTRAIAELINNPFPITESGLKSGELLYNSLCGICHGKKGDGNGWLVDEANAYAVYPAQPANFLSDEFVASSNGRYYHSIIYGKNVMGGYADKLSYEERWNVIHWIRSLQAKEKGKEYTPQINTLNNIDVPFSQVKQIASKTADGHHHDGHDNHGDHDHGTHMEDHGDHSHDGGDHGHEHH